MEPTCADDAASGSARGARDMWFQALGFTFEGWFLSAGRQELLWALLLDWLRVVGQDGWMWCAAGFTVDEARVLSALPDGHPDRPGPDQLAVMVALRGTRAP